MLHLYLIRHGETDSNIAARHLGHTDIAMNDTGQSQVAKLKQYFKDIPLDAIYVSDLKRTVDTARQLGELFVLTPKLRERNFGIFEDLTFAEIVAQYPDLQKQWQADWIDYVIPHGESARTVFDRNAQAVADILAKHQTGHVAVVTHLGVIRNVLAYLCEMPIAGAWHFRVENASVTRVDIQDGYAVLQFQ
ncbi:MAG: histidine phosphatase family protein [Hyphomonadaceae bacterium]|nr:histidine phosphatase family protein [Clostridia bacterium]